ncbi:Aste57867_12213 [Aphanomyces stellatus]|uniref:Aste57867_12213 protein n=1 Tax=Aphanomyces stellatus TaxID=120398 RepID=A0A485KUZ1_9STRA|nr:hypothetical protein As57867_012168 [Aphanomyces stellatus]VFT89067.1 Aste57867_12213 [Aphanomyces stellatus]
MATAALRQVWTEIGLDLIEQERALERQLQEFLEYKLMDAENTKSHYLEEISALDADVATFVSQLGDPFKHPERGDAAVETLMDQLARVRADHAALKKVVDDRTAALSVVVKELASIQSLMGETPYAAPVPLDLTPVNFDKLKEVVRVKKIEESNRRQAIRIVAKEYRVLIEQLKVFELNDFDRAITTDVDALGLSMNLIELISTRIAEATKLKTEREETKSALLKQIHALWDRLKISSNAQDDFLDSIKGIGADDVQATHDELARLQHLKRERIGELITDVRGQIVTLWQGLEIPESDFLPTMLAPLADATDDLLTAHEDELKRLDAQLTARKALIKYLEKREEIITERAQYEESLKDPERLIGRGARDSGRLLREEKLQAKIKHDLPKLTKLLVEKLPAWETDFNMPFVFQGERYLDTIERVDSDYAKQKEIERLEKERMKREKKAGSAVTLEDKPKPKPKPTSLTKRMSCPNQAGMLASAPSPVLHNAVSLGRESLTKCKLVGGPESNAY